MNFISINQIPKGAVKDGFSEEVKTPGVACLCGLDQDSAILPGTHPGWT